MIVFKIIIHSIVCMLIYTFSRNIQGLCDEHPSIKTIGDIVLIKRLTKYSATTNYYSYVCLFCICKKMTLFIQTGSPSIYPLSLDKQNFEEPLHLIIFPLYYLCIILQSHSFFKNLIIFLCECCKMLICLSRKHNKTSL